MHQQHTPADRQQDRPFHQPNRSYRGQCQRGQRRRLASGAQPVSDAPRGTFNPADDTRDHRASNGARSRARGVRGTGDDSPRDVRRTGDCPLRDVRRTSDSPLSGVRRTGQGALSAFLKFHANSLAAHPSSQKVYPWLPSDKPKRNRGVRTGEITRPRRSVGSQSQAEAEVAGHQGQPFLNLQLIAGVGDQIVPADQRAQDQHRLVQSELPSDA